MEERRRTRSQGPPSISENNELIQWDSLQDPVRMEREQAEARSLARQINTVTSIDENKAESSKISQKGDRTLSEYRTHAQIGQDLAKRTGIRRHSI